MRMSRNKEINATSACPHTCNGGWRRGRASGCGRVEHGCHVSVQGVAAAEQPVCRTLQAAVACTQRCCCLDGQCAGALRQAEHIPQMLQACAAVLLSTKVHTYDWQRQVHATYVCPIHGDATEVA